MKTPLFALALLAAGSVGGVEIRLQVLDEAKRPLPAVSILAGFGNARPRDDVMIQRVTDKDGRIVVQGTAIYRMFVKAQLAGHYDVECLDLDIKRDHDLTVIMRRIIRPIPLYVDTCTMKSADFDEALVDSYVERTLEYDFEMGALLPPHGQGRIADVRVHSRAWFVGWTLDEEKLKVEEENFRRIGRPLRMLRQFYGRWRSEQVITFPGKDAGFVRVTPPDFQRFSGLMLPHEAPVEGYQPELRGQASYDGPWQEEWNRPASGYFLRTRVKHDAEGRIVSAHYGKVVGPFVFEPSGTLTFRYHFNPTPNDRNLEFDPVKNLFDAKKRGAQAPYR
jgi:hypothetical protein